MTSTLIFVPPGYPEEAGQQLCTSLRQALSLRFPRTAEQPMKLSTQWYTEHLPAAGSWEAWAYDTVHGKVYGGDARFSLFVLTSPILGRATANIMRAALQAKRPCFLYVVGSGPPLRVVTGVEELNPDSWRAGWLASHIPLPGDEP